MFQTIKHIHDYVGSAEELWFSRLIMNDELVPLPMEIDYCQDLNDSNYTVAHAANTTLNRTLGKGDI